jgi:hypothetical protein
MKDLILRNERYVAQYKRKKIMRNRLVLRDERGRIRVTSKDPCQERRIVTLGARVKVDPQVCRSIVKRGFKHSLICGGILRNRVTGEREYRRYQVFKADKWTRREVGRMYTFFKRNVPVERIGFYVLHNGNLYMPEERLK